MTDDKRRKRRPLKVPADVPPPPAVAVPVPPAAPRNDEPTVRTSKPVTKAPAGTAGTCPRDALVDAVTFEALDGGASPRDALRVAEAVADRLRLEGFVGPGTLRGLVDLRAEQDFDYPNGKRKVKKRGTAVVYRDPKTIDTIVVHQTACEFGVSNRAVTAAGGNIELARARRALDVACHALAFRHGYFVAAHPLTAYVQHGNRFNDRSLGLEIEGRYAGLVDDPSTVAREDLATTWGGKPTTLDERTAKTACDALAWLVEEAAREGIVIRRVVSHRQSSDTRRSDPGQEIWRVVVLDFARDVMGLEVVRVSPWREGRPVPIEWDPDGIGSY